MTKSLTEQWREGTLPRGGYYIKLLDGSIKQTNYDNICKTFDTEYFRYNVSVKEVLATVPNYDEWQAELDSNNELLNVQKRLEKKIKLLEEQLNYALETMNQIAKLSDNTVDAVQCAHAICLINERLKEMEGVK